MINPKIKNLLISNFLIISIIFNFLLIGAILNLYIISENSGKMPVYLIYDFYSERHFGFDNFEEVNHPFLADIFKVNNIFTGNYNYLSIGDILMFSSVIALTVFSVIFIIRIFKLYKDFRLAGEIMGFH